jgi:hypothetical protein
MRRTFPAVRDVETSCNTVRNYDYEFQANRLVKVFDKAILVREVPYRFTTNEIYSIEIDDSISALENDFATRGQIFICNDYMEITTRNGDGPTDIFLKN